MTLRPVVSLYPSPANAPLVLDSEGVSLLRRTLALDPDISGFDYFHGFGPELEEAGVEVLLDCCTYDEFQIGFTSRLPEVLGFMELGALIEASALEGRRVLTVAGFELGPTRLEEWDDDQAVGHFIPVLAWSVPSTDG